MYAIGQTVLFNKSVKGHVVLVTDKSVSVRTSITGATIVCAPSELKILSEEALPLEAAPIPREHQVATSEVAKSASPIRSAATPGSKKEQALNIYRTLRATDGFSRKSCIQMFQETLGMSEAGASTYFNMSKQALTN